MVRVALQVVDHLLELGDAVDVRVDLDLTGREVAVDDDVDLALGAVLPRTEAEVDLGGAGLGGQVEVDVDAERAAGVGLGGVDDGHGDGLRRDGVFGGAHGVPFLKWPSRPLVCPVISIILTRFCKIFSGNKKRPCGVFFVL